MSRHAQGISRSLICCLVLAIGSAGSAFAAESGAETVLINGEVKRVEGILRGAEAGDIACYLTLETDAGEMFQESAAFEFCDDPSLIGQRLKLSYTVENVLAAECQGDMDCGKSDQIVLVSAVRVLASPPLRGADYRPGDR